MDSAEEDVVIRVDNVPCVESFRVKKHLLISGSEYFEGCFRGSFAESTNQDVKIILPCNEIFFFPILDYIVEGTINSLMTQRGCICGYILNAEYLLLTDLVCALRNEFQNNFKYFFSTTQPMIGFQFITLDLCAEVFRDEAWKDEHLSTLVEYLEAASIVGQWVESWKGEFSAFLKEEYDEISFLEIQEINKKFGFEALPTNLVYGSAKKHYDYLIRSSTIDPFVCIECHKMVVPITKCETHPGIYFDGGLVPGWNCCGKPKKKAKGCEWKNEYHKPPKK